MSEQCNHFIHLSLAAICASSSIIGIAWCSARALPASDSHVPGSATWQARRIESASKLIREFDRFSQRARKLHKNLTLEIAQATGEISEIRTLRGEARKLQTMMPSTPLKLSKAQYQAALQQFNAHVNEFRLHAGAYYDSRAKFSRDIGECKTNQKQYEEYARKYQLHTEEFHIPNVTPPHVCGTLNLSSEEALRLSGTLRSDLVRAAAAEAQLQNEEQRLRAAEHVSSMHDGMVMAQAMRERREQELAAAFGRLRQEYELLTAEKSALGGRVPPVTNSRVTGTVRKKTSKKRAL